MFLSLNIVFETRLCSCSSRSHFHCCTLFPGTNTPYSYIPSIAHGHWGCFCWFLVYSFDQRCHEHSYAHLLGTCVRVPQTNMPESHGEATRRPCIAADTAKVAGPTGMPTNSECAFTLPLSQWLAMSTVHLLPTGCCEMGCHYGFNMHFLTTNKVDWHSSDMCCVFPSIKCLFLVFALFSSIVLSFAFRIIRILSMCWIPVLCMFCLQGFQ